MNVTTNSGYVRLQTSCIYCNMYLILLGHILAVNAFPADYLLFIQALS